MSSSRRAELITLFVCAAIIMCRCKRHADPGRSVQAAQSDVAPSAANPLAPTAATGLEPSRAPDGRGVGMHPTNRGKPFVAPRPVFPDRGIYADLDERVVVELPPWLDGEPLDTVSTGGDQNLVYSGGQAIAFADRSVAPTVRVESFEPQDADGDGIPDALDILLGAKKVALAAAPYVETYRKLPYPNGDLPRDEGVCTDVIVRAMRNAGFDLQKLVHMDAVAKPRAYPNIARPDASADHRRVKNLVVWFERHWQRLPADPHDRSAPWLPGDVVFLDTMRDPQPDHVGIVSDRAGPSGMPLIVNSWTNGYVSAEMDLLGSIPVTHRYRVPAPRLEVAESSRGLGGVLARAGLALPDGCRQALLVTSSNESSSRGSLRRFWRDESGRWRAEARAVPVRLGGAGMARGKGLCEPKTGAPGSVAEKKEGDGRSPAGVFALGEAFGTKIDALSRGMGWPVGRVDAQDVWVDDPQSGAYNTRRRLSELPDAPPWRSAESLSTYALALVIHHNDAPVVPGAGSAIFLHAWDLDRATAGCTGISFEDLRAIVAWLDPAASPVLVQLPTWVWE